MEYLSTNHELITWLTVFMNHEFYELYYFMCMICWCSVPDHFTEADLFLPTITAVLSLGVILPDVSPRLDPGVVLLTELVPVTGVWYGLALSELQSVSLIVINIATIQSCLVFKLLVFKRYIKIHINIPWRASSLVHCCWSTTMCWAKHCTTDIAGIIGQRTAAWSLQETKYCRIHE